MKTVPAKCKSCGAIIQVKLSLRDNQNTKWFSINWCPECADNATAEYTETPMYYELGKPRKKRKNKQLQLQLFK